MADYPYINVTGHELDRLISKGMWAALTVDLVRQLIGEDIASSDRVQAEIVTRLDNLYHAGIVPRTLPARIPRTAAIEEI